MPACLTELFCGITAIYGDMGSGHIGGGIRRQKNNTPHQIGVVPHAPETCAFTVLVYKKIGMFRLSQAARMNAINANLT